MTFILAKKLNMTQLFSEDGEVVPVTVLQAGPCKVERLKSKDKDSYEAVVLSFGKETKEFRLKAGEESPKKAGEEITVNDFKLGDVIDLKGTSLGRGFAGAMKRHGFHGAPATHGHDHPRAVGSIGQMFPQHIRKGLRMAGHMGAANVTVKNSVVIGIDPEKNLLFVKGGVPGHFGSLIKVVSTGKNMEIKSVFEFVKEANKAVSDEDPVDKEPAGDESPQTEPESDKPATESKAETAETKTPEPESEVKTEEVKSN